MENGKFRIVTNNPIIKENAEFAHEIIFVKGSPIDVLNKSEELLQQNWKMRSTPLPPNIPIMRAPYRSLVIQESDKQYDSLGILAVSKARERYIRERQFAVREESNDFAIIDNTMLKRTLRDISLIDTQ
ncbi:MAG: GrdX family protein [Synergistaceae bacterium]